MQTSEIRFLTDLRDQGYFKAPTFDPREVIEAARRVFGIDTQVRGGNDRLAETINGLVQSGVIAFEYSQDPNLHPKDVLDYWRISLTPKGEMWLQEAEPQSQANSSQVVSSPKSKAWWKLW